MNKRYNLDSVIVDCVGRDVTHFENEKKEKINLMCSDCWSAVINDIYKRFARICPKSSVRDEIKIYSMSI